MNIQNGNPSGHNMNLADKLEEFKKTHEFAKNESLNDRVVLVDSMNTFIRCHSAISEMNAEGMLIGGVCGFLKSVGSYIRKFRPTRVICVFDGVGGSVKRRKLFDGYKGNRKMMESLNRAYELHTPEEEREMIKWQMSMLIQALDELPTTTYAIENIEADDTIAYLSRVIQDKGGKVVIFSSDKDFYQLVSDTCWVYSPTKKKMYTPEAILEEFQIHPNNFLSYRAIEGDTSDNIPGVNGIAHKTFVKTFPMVSQAKEYTMQELMDTLLVAQDFIALGNIDAKKSKQKKIPAVYTKLLDAHKNGLIARNYELMNLREVDIAGTTKLKILDKFNTSPNTLNKLALTNLFTNNKLLDSFGNFHEWIQQTWLPLIRFKDKQ